MSHTIAFVNGKGGTGKTSLSMLVAWVLKDRGQDVCVDDRDPPNPAGFGEDIIAEKFAVDALREGLSVEVPEIAPWESHDEISCFPLFRRPSAGGSFCRPRDWGAAG